jgi:hypothetical protein
MNWIKTRLIAFALFAAAASQAKAPETSPQIGVSRTIELSPSYSCRPADEFQRGYQKTALFLSEEMRQRNSPDLLFNGACGSENYFQAATHGGNHSVIADLSTKPGAAAAGTERLMQLDAQKDRDALKRMGFDNDAAVVPGHTYAILLHKHGVRGLMLVTVSRHVQDKGVELTYELLNYQVTAEQLLARGADCSAMARWPIRSQAHLRSL